MHLSLSLFLSLSLSLSLSLAMCAYLPCFHTVHGTDQRRPRFDLDSARCLLHINIVSQRLRARTVLVCDGAVLLWRTLLLACTIRPR